MINTVMIQEFIGKTLPLLSTIETDLLKHKAREDFERKVLERHEAKVRYYKEKKERSNATNSK